ncbi:MAG: hypothetical protein WBB74_08100 [Gaiellaceae bacterium]
MAKTRDKVAGRVSDARPYVERAIKDEEFRQNLRSAYSTARDVYDELIGRRGVTGAARRAATDRDIQDSLKQAIDDLRAASTRLQKAESHKSRNTTLLLAGITLGILFNPLTGAETRRWLKDKVLGGEDEFGYGGDNNQ